MTDFISPAWQQHASLLLGLAGLAIVAYVYSILSAPLAKIPGPWHSLFTGQLIKIYGLQGKRTRYVHSLHQKYGPVVRLSPREVDVTDLPSVKEIHAVKATYTKSPHFYHALRAPGTENVFSTTDVFFHRRHRKLLQGPFSESSLKTLQPIIEARVNMAIDRMAEEMKTRQVADVFKWWLFMATDVIGELTFGESFRMLELGKKNEYSLNLEQAAAVGAKRTAFPLLARLASAGLPIPGFGDSTRLIRNNEKFATESLQRYRKLVRENPDQPINTLFKKVFKGEQQEELTLRELIDSAQVYIIAGSDTTALALTYLVWQVCCSPEIRDRLVQELQQVPDEYHDDDLQHLAYLQQVIEETLRVYSPAPSALPRIVPQGGSTLAGQYLPGGAIVSTQAFSLHRNPDIFPDPDTFDPDRWAHPTKAMKDSMMPFGGGSRICMGLHLARIELRLGIARFFRAFPHAKVSTREGFSDQDMVQMLFFLGPPKGKRCLIECA
ncbi:cytochrome protein [Coniella lustricola]|uniref:Cytochrome protein n=1 Tax=Coniella lustricola TaxID=2025994 RepID=A0A2T3AH64_9PEZI|nr:cytochrome protein [Coniella lustricola]